MQHISAEPSNSERNRVNVKIIVDLVQGMQHGDLIPHRVLQTAVNISDGDRTKLYALMAQAKEILRKDYGLFVSCETGLGYRILERGREINLCHAMFQAGRKKIRRSVYMANDIRVKDLSEDDRSKALTDMQRLANYHQMLGSE